MNILLTSVIAALSAAIPAPLAADWYIARTGSDSLGKGSFEQPFATFSKCCTAMAPGDTCYARGGTYVTSSLDGWKLACTGGTSDAARKTFTSYPSERVVIEPSSLTDKTMTIATGPDYLTFRNLTIKGKVSVLAEGNGADFLVFENIKFLCPGEDGSGNCTNITTQTFYYPDWEELQGLVIRNNLFIADSSCSHSYQNEAEFIHLYSTDGALIEGNDFIYSRRNDRWTPRYAVWLKGRNERAVIRFNYTRGDLGSAFGINGDMCSHATDYCRNVKPTGVAQNRIYQNVSDRSGGIGFDSADFGEGDFVYNNTIYMPLNDGFHAGPSQSPLIREQVFNNIIYGGSRSAPEYYSYVRWDGLREPVGSGLCQQTFFDHNIYFPLSSKFRNFANLQDQAVTLEDWQRLLATQCSNPDVRDSHSRSVDPMFVDASKRNFRLAASSPARVGGRGNGYPTVLGAYVTGSETIGCTFSPECSSSPTPSPDVVNGVRRSDGW